MRTHFSSFNYQWVGACSLLWLFCGQSQVTIPTLLEFSLCFVPILMLEELLSKAICSVCQKMLVTWDVYCALKKKNLVSSSIKIKINKYWIPVLFFMALLQITLGEIFKWKIPFALKTYLTYTVKLVISHSLPPTQL